MPGLSLTQQDIDQFVAITQASHEDAEHFLSAGTTLEGAIEDFYAAQSAADQPAPHSDLDEEGEEVEASFQEAMSSEDQPQQPEQAAEPTDGPRTLGGRPAGSLPPPGWGQPVKKTGRIGEWTPEGGQRRPGEIATLFNSGDGGSASSPMPAGYPGGDDDDDDSDEDSGRGQEFYAGGERSGLAIQNPDRPGGDHQGIVGNILRQAADNSKSRKEEQTSTAASGSNLFAGSGNTLGSEETPSPAAPDTSAPPVTGAAPPVAPGGLLSALLGRLGGQAQSAEPEDDTPQTRHLIFWRDGFSIEDGPLMRYDAPGNRELLEAIQNGRAPPSVFNVRFNQNLSVEVAQRTNEDYREPPKQPSKPFGGSGNRLGSPAPEIAGSGSSTPNVPGGLQPQSILQGSQPATGASASAESQTKFEVDESKPTTSVQMRLGDGTRLVARVNLTHTVADLRQFVSAARSDARPFLLQTTFPSRELADANETVQGAKLQNAVVVQRFT